MTRKLWLLDAHCDSFEMRNFLKHEFDLSKSKLFIQKTVLNFLNDSFKTEFPAKTVNNYHVTFSRLATGHVKVLFLNIGDYDFLSSSKMLNAAYELVNKYPHKIVIGRNKNEILRSIQQNKLILVLSVEGPIIFQGQIDLMEHWHRLGVRVINLSHGEGTQGFAHNAKIIYKELEQTALHCSLQVTTSAECYMSSEAREKLRSKERGLSEFGKRMLNKMERLNILCDLSHANDAAFWETLETTSGKVCVTHSNCSSLCPHTRNLTDAMMTALAEHNGVMGLCFYGPYISEHKPSLKLFVEHVLHALSVMGPDHVGIGSDFDGVQPGAFMAIPHPGHINDLWEALDKAGVNQKTLKKIAHENFLRLM